MAVLSGPFGQAFASGRAEKAAEPPKPRTSLLGKAGHFLGRHVPRWNRVRSTLLQVSAFGAIDYGLFEWNPIAGFIGTGVSLLILDTLSGDE